MALHTPIVNKRSPNNGPNVPEDHQALPEEEAFSPKTCRPFLVEAVILRMSQWPWPALGKARGCKKYALVS